MEQKLLGELFGVRVHSPLVRGEVREVLRKQLEFKSELQANQKLTEEQAFLEVADIFENFFSGISKEEVDVFNSIHQEEMGAAPKEWFGNSETLDCSALAQTGSAGELYGIQVLYPFTRANIREVVKAKATLMQSMSSSQGISIYQAANDLSDIHAEFLKRLNLGDQEVFLNLLTEETNAHTSALLDDASKTNQEAIKQEISNANLTSTMAGIIVFCCLMFLFFVVFK